MNRKLIQDIVARRAGKNAALTERSPTRHFVPAKPGAQSMRQLRQRHHDRKASRIFFKVRRGEPYVDAKGRSNK